MKQKILITFIVLFELLALVSWTRCVDLQRFHFSSLDLQLRLIESIHNDQFVPVWEVRFLHNKITGAGFDILGDYLRFWDPVFLAHVISPAGIVGLGAGLYLFFARKKKRIFVWLLFASLLFAPLVEIFFYDKLAFLLRWIILAIPFILWSTWGYWQLITAKKISVKIILLLLVISLAYTVVAFSLMAFCPSVS